MKTPDLPVPAESAAPPPAPPAADGASPRAAGDERGARAYEQLLRVQQRLQVGLEETRETLEGEPLRDLIREVRARTGTDASEAMAEVLSRVEEALRALKVCESDLRRELADPQPLMEVNGLPDLPPFVARFLAERSESPGFTCQVIQDPVRGWIVRWKEFAAQGSVRGAGQIYERPYAWLDE